MRQQEINRIKYPWMFEEKKPEEQLYVVRQWDGFDGCWTDITSPISKEEAERVWNKYTDNGTKKTSFDDIDYYHIFPANTRMIFDEQSAMERER
jgi:hypothetical protein